MEAKLREQKLLSTDMKLQAIVSRKGRSTFNGLYPAVSQEIQSLLLGCDVVYIVTNVSRTLLT